MKNFPEPSLLKSFEAIPESGVIPSSLKLTTIEFQCTPTTSMNLHNVPVYICSLLDSSKEQVIVAKFPVCVSIASFYNTLVFLFFYGIKGKRAHLWAPCGKISRRLRRLRRWLLAYGGELFTTGIFNTPQETSAQLWMEKTNDDDDILLVEYIKIVIICSGLESLLLLFMILLF